MKRLPLQMTFFSQVHPVASTIYFTELIVCLLLFNHVIVALAEIVSLIICGFYYLGVKSMTQQLKFGGSFLIMILFFNTLLNQKFQPILWHFHWGVITYKFSYPAFLYGMAMAIVLISMLFIFALLNKILTPNRLIYVFSPIAPRLAMLVSISFSLVANFIIKFRRLITLQKKREMSILPVVH
ncbi:energy-coupling factor transporter transmembrane protein EcfT [Lentilactobacillus kisonensis]|uniref:energy-coupling factor transporter transmembrane protein EcfT n=1 Tax=Lentilactobacillus kisonensis TaxID=481722 RepID=UPI000A6F20BB|nr:energy-coupling factor transporter transmembrane protein EcfT [Lentilactobacillus kisonensis]